MIRFEFVGAHTTDRPVSRSSPSTYNMARCDASLPIQDDIGGVASRRGETNIKKSCGVRLEPETLTE